MAIFKTSGIQRKPNHHGEILREDFIPDYGLTVSGLVESFDISRQSVNELLRERRAVSAEMALWLNAQRLVGLWTATQSVKDVLDLIMPLRF